MAATITTRATAVRAGRSAVIVGTVGGVAALNLVIYLVGRASGGTFTYTQAGKPTRVDVVAVILMSAVPLAVGLTLSAWLSYRWPAFIATARVVAPALAIATILVMTVPAGFDLTSTTCLAMMHLAVAPAAVLALNRFRAHRPR